MARNARVSGATCDRGIFCIVEVVLQIGGVHQDRDAKIRLALVAVRRELC